MRLRIGELLIVAISTLSMVSGCSGQVADLHQRPVVGGSLMGSVAAVSKMSAKRAGHTATLLNNGKVLITGGFVSGGSLSSAELFDPVTSTFTSAGNMAVARYSHTASLLPDGKVLIAGGANGSYLDTSEIYDPATNRFTLAGRLVSPRSEHVAVTLKNGTILMAGGVGTGWTFLKSAEIYDPRSGTFSPTGEMSTERESHTATLLRDGKVLITGGHKDRRSNIKIYRSAEIYDPVTRTFSTTGELTVKRHKHEATILPNGRVLIIGGSDERDGDGAYRNAEVFDPVTSSFTAVENSMNTARYKLQGTAVLLQNGKVLIAGGSDRAEVFDPATNRFSLTAGEMGSLRLFARATLLQSGRVLITGGYHNPGAISDGAWIFTA